MFMAALNQRYRSLWFHLLLCYNLGRLYRMLIYPALFEAVENKKYSYLHTVLTLCLCEVRKKNDSRIFGNLPIKTWCMK